MSRTKDRWLELIEAQEWKDYNDEVSQQSRDE